MYLSVIRGEQRASCRCCGEYSNIAVAVFVDGMRQPVSQLLGNTHMLSRDNLNDPVEALNKALGPLKFAASADPEDNILVTGARGAILLEADEVEDLMEWDDPSRLIGAVLARFGYPVGVEGSVPKPRPRPSQTPEPPEAPRWGMGF